MLCSHTFDTKRGGIVVEMDKSSFKMLSKETCLPTYRAKQSCYCISVSSGKVLGGRGGGALFTTDQYKALERWKITPSDGGLKISSMEYANRTMGLLFGEFEYGIGRAREVAMPLLLKKAERSYYTIESTELGKGLACSCTGRLYIASIEEGDEDKYENCRWICRWITGEICRIVNPTRGISLSLSLTGLPMPLLRGQRPPEDWCFSEVGDGSVVISARDESMFLCSNGDGDTFTTNNGVGSWEQWVILKHCVGGVLIKSLSHDRYLATADTKVVTSTEISDDSIWSLDSAQHSKLTIVSSEAGFTQGNLSIRVYENGQCTIKREELWMGNINNAIDFSRTAQLWRIHHAGSSKFFLSTTQNCFLECANDGLFKLEKLPENDEAGRFWFNIQSPDESCISGMLYGMLPETVRMEVGESWPVDDPFLPSLACIPSLRRPFANWRAWPVEEI
jgi:hypothetical protein